ncbi:hypothetical protein [Streptomyces monashensis]|nr:hypothetical protein [Streptomyces monashensis]
MDEMFEPDDYLAEFFAALTALEAGEQLASPSRFRRVELDFGGETAWFEGMFGGETFGVDAGKGPRAVYLMLDGDGEAGTDRAGDVVPEVRAVLVRFGDTLPVEAGWEGERLLTPSGFLVLHGHLLNSGLEGLLPVVTRALAALKRRPPVQHGHWDRAADLEQGLAQAGIDAATLTAAAEPGDFTEGWLIASDGPSKDTVLGCFVDPDGCQLLPCLDAEGNEVAALLH